MKGQAGVLRPNFQGIAAALTSFDASRPDVVIVWAFVAIAVIILFLHWVDDVAGWVATMIVQMLQLLSGIYVLVTLQEYEEKMAREPADVQKVVNPMRTCLTALRVLHLSEYVLLRSWVYSFCVMLPIAAFDFTPWSAPKVDATRLWKESTVIKNELKYRMIFDVIFFFVTMFYMLYNLIFNL